MNDPVSLLAGACIAGLFATGGLVMVTVGLIREDLSSDLRVNLGVVGALIAVICTYVALFWLYGASCIATTSCL